MRMCHGAWLLCLLQLCAGSRLLVVFPVPSASHALLGDSLVSTLLTAGHEVTYVSGSSALLPRSHLTSINISFTDPATDIQRQSLLELVHDPRPPQRVLEVGTSFARRALEHNATQRLLADVDLNFDLVIADWFYTGLLAPLASVFNCPLIWYSSGDVSWMNLQLMHGHANPAYSADPQSKSLPSEDGVAERMARLWRQAYLSGWVYYMMCYVEEPIYYELYQAAFTLRGHTLPDYEPLVYNGSLMLVNSHPLLGQALSLPQSVKYIGGHHIDVPTKPLPKSLKQLMDRSTNGVIYFSLGSKVKRKDIPERMQRKLIDLFGHLEQTVIWQFEETIMGLPRNVHIFKKAPQKSILNHTNTVLLITHGGYTSCMEAAYFGVPFIGVPLSEGHFLPVALAAARGRALLVPFSDALPYRLYDAVHYILGNESYGSSARQASALFRRALVPPRRALLHWVGLVAGGAGGAGALRSPGARLSAPRRYYLDCLALLLMLLWLGSKLIKLIKAHRTTDHVEEERKNK